jgi:glycosyltransferase involved in cell wall biosynthesis
MRIAFVDIAYGYTADRPEADAPLGGTTSALCFLARALHDAGVTCTIFNKVDAPQTAHGITSLPLEALTDERRNPAYNAFVFCGRWTDWLVQLVAEATTAPLLAWMHESRFEPKLVPALPQFHGVAFVSDWQAKVNHADLLPMQRSAILRNAMGLTYETMVPPGTAITADKKPIAVYVGATPRGLIHLPTIWPLIHAACPELTLQIYANPALDRDPAVNAQFAAQLRSMIGVTHVGMVGQPRLAQALREASFYLGPNPYPETSCIAMIEAMAAGLCCITTARAALPETAQGFATLLPIAAADDPYLFTQEFDSVAFAQTTIAIVRDRLAHPVAWEPKLRAQIDHFQTHYRWRDRAAPWTTFVTSCATA